MTLKLIENSESRLTFVTDPTAKIIGLLAFAIVLLPFLYWGLFISPVYSSLRCQRTNTGIDCMLVERKAIALKSDKTDIKNVKDVDGILLGLLNNKQIVIKASPERSHFSLLGYQRKYYYPSTANTLIYLNPYSGTNLFKQRIQLNNFVRGKTDSDNIKVDLKLGRLPVLCILVFTSFVFSIIISSPFQSTYDFDGQNKTLTILLKRIILNDITRTYSFDKLEVRFDCDNSGRIPVATIVLKFNPDYDYPIADFTDLEEGEDNFQMINNFVNKYK